MAEINQLVKPILQISLEHLRPSTINDLEQGINCAENLVYYKKNIGDEASVGFFLVCNEDMLEQAMPDDLRLVLTLGSAMNAYYVEIDEMFEMCNLLPYYNQSL